MSLEALEIRDTDEPYARPLADILGDLRRPIPDHIIQSKQVGARRFRFISAKDTVSILDQFAPGWEGHVTNIYAVHDRLFVSYKITLHAREGKFSRESTGSTLLDSSGADPAVAGEEQAFRNAAAKFGLGLYL